MEVALAAMLCGVLLALPAPAGAAIFSCLDASGRVILRDVPCKRGETGRLSAEGESPATPKRSRPPAAAVSASRSIAVQDVQAFIDGLDDAIARRDVAAILAYFASDAALEMEYRLPQGLRVANFDKTTYATMLRETLGPGSAYTYQRERPRIVLSSDQRQAEVLSTVHETVVLDGKRLQGTTRSRLTVEWRDARLQITLARGSTRFDPEPGAEGAQPSAHDPRSRKASVL